MARVVRHCGLAGASDARRACCRDAATQYGRASAQSGIDIVTISQWLGHASAITTNQLLCDQKSGWSLLAQLLPHTLQRPAQDRLIRFGPEMHDMRAEPL